MEKNYLMQNISKRANVYIHDREFKGQAMHCFDELGNNKYKIVDSLDESDIFVLTGGEDIYAGLYGETNRWGDYNIHRDRYDIKGIEQALAKNKFMVGICRGAQLLNCIPNGGKLWQDVDRHGGYHRTFDCFTGNYYVLNSVHHQAMKPADGAEILAWAFESTKKQSDGEKWTKGDLKLEDVPEWQRDMEALWYPKTRSFLFQAHPEFGHVGTTRYFHNLLDRVYWGQSQEIEYKEAM